MRIVSFQCVLFLFLCSGLNAADTPKSLTIMLDGARADVMLMGKLPALDSVRNGTWADGYHGAWSLAAHTIKDTVTVSAPNHTAIATGVTASKSNVVNNGHFGKYIESGTAVKYPTFLTRIQQKYPNKKTAFAASWKPDKNLADAPNSCGTYIAGNDQSNAQKILPVLQDEKTDAVVWYIDAPDHAGHTTGYAPPNNLEQYIKTMEECDTWIYEALERIKKRPAFADENWQIIVTSDHGGWHKGHGEMTAACYTIPFFVSSKNIHSGEIAGQPCNADAAATVLAHYGFDVDALKKDGSIDGSVRGLSGTDLSRPAGLTLTFFMKLSKQLTGNVATFGGVEFIAAPEGKSGNTLSLKLTDESKTTLELRQLFVPENDWVFVAVSVDQAANAMFYAGLPDGTLQFISQSTADENLGKSFGRLTGKLNVEPQHFAPNDTVEIKDISVLNTALPVLEVQKLFKK